MAKVKVEAHELDTLAETIIYHIGVGKANAVSRKYLSLLVGVSDRAVRKAVERARQHDYLICNDQTGKGYYMADDLDEIEAQAKQMYNRAMAILRSRKPFRKVLKQAGRTVK